jgi:hypothetical protein
LCCGIPAVRFASKEAASEHHRDSHPLLDVHQTLLKAQDTVFHSAQSSLTAVEIFLTSLDPSFRAIP